MNNRFVTPNWVKRHFGIGKLDALPATRLKAIQKGIAKFKVAKPLASIVVPAYNEEENILGTIASFSELIPDVPTELLFVNNNSTDRTQEILDACGVPSIFEKKQGRTYARQGGLEAAKGKIILSADADSIYPNDWGNAFVKTLLEQEDIVVVYGRYSFIPSHIAGRLGLAIHEFGGELMFDRRKGIELCINAVGFNSAFRREQALSVGGYDPEMLEFHNQRSEDGWLAQSLNKKFGRIAFVKTKNRVWTSDRRLLEEGSLIRASLNRVYRYLNGTNLANT